MPSPDGPPPDLATQHRTIAGMALALISLAGLLGLSFPTRGIYVVLYALVAGILALWLAVSALRRARRNRTAPPRGSRTAVLIACAGVALSASALVVFVMMGKQLSAYGECLSGANTLEAQHSCRDQFNQAVDHEISVLRSGGHG
jgi:hypothetical protein